MAFKPDSKKMGKDEELTTRPKGPVANDLYTTAERLFKDDPKFRNQPKKQIEYCDARLEELKKDLKEKIKLENPELESGSETDTLVEKRWEEEMADQNSLTFGFLKLKGKARQEIIKIKQANEKVQQQIKDIDSQIEDARKEIEKLENKIGEADGYTNVNSLKAQIAIKESHIQTLIDQQENLKRALK